MFRFCSLTIIGLLNLLLVSCATDGASTGLSENKGQDIPLICWSEQELDAHLLTYSDFPDGWTANKTTDFTIEAKKLEFTSAKIIKVVGALYPDTSLANTEFQTLLSLLKVLCFHLGQMVAKPQQHPLQLYLNL